MNRIHNCQRIFQLWQKAKQFYENLNLFPSALPSIDAHELKNQRISTRLYILLLIISISILLLYTSLATVTKTISIPTPTLTQYSELYTKYSRTVLCPCTRISIKYEKFLYIDYTFHQVCTSIFITDDWISHNDVIRLNLLISNDLRTVIPYAFQSLRAFCELTKNTISNSMAQFNSSQYITASVVPLQLFQLQTQSFIDQFRSSTTNSFISSLNTSRKMNQGNALLSAQLTNYELHVTQDDNHAIATPVTYSNCDCHVSSACVKQFSFQINTDNTTLFNVPGFYTGCYVIEALLQSTLECFYDQHCIDQLQMYLSSIPPMNATALNSSVQSRYFQNTTVEDLLNNLMIEKWNSTQIYDHYYDECQPIECTYTVEARENGIYIITTFISMIGGLVTVLKLIVPRVVKFIRMKKSRSSRSNFGAALRTFIRHFFPKFKNYCITLNVFKSPLPSTDEHELKNQRISTRLYILLLTISISILLLYTSLATITKTVSIPTPTLTQYSELYATYLETLLCECTHISINYENFLHINYTLHQVCTSIFITDDWISYLGKLYEATYVNNDFLRTGSNSFQALHAFCELIESTISNSMIQLNSSQYITASVVPLQLFQLQTQSFIAQFQLSTTNNFLLSLNTIQNTTYGNTLMSALMTSYLIINYDEPTPILSTPVSYSSCSCHVSSRCTIPSSVWNSFTNVIDFTIPGFYTGCFVVEALLQSTLECFYDQTCIDQLQMYLPSTSHIVAPALNSSVQSRYFKDSTIEDLLNNLMIEKWDSTQMYDRYYDECKPKQCTYTIKTRNDVVFIITTLFGIIGGLMTVLKFVVPRLVKFVKKKKDSTQSVTMIKKRERAITFWRKFKDGLLKLNLFSTTPPSRDEYELRIQRIFTRLFILLLILLSTILLLYTSLKHVTMPVTINAPTVTQYSALYLTYSQALVCPCTHISINYEKFLHIDYTLHQVCTSAFITEDWISYISVPRAGFYVIGDFRMSGPNQFVNLRAFCQLIDSIIENRMIQFNSSQYITASVVPLQLFQLQTQSFIDQFRSSTTNDFLLSLNMLRKTNQGNALLPGKQTHYKPYKQNEGIIRFSNRYYSDCNCGLSMKCMDNSSLFNGVNNIRVFNVTGFYSGCYTVEALLQSTFECFYDQRCIDQLQNYLLAPIMIGVNALDPSLPSRYFQNTTVEDLLNNLMIEIWNSTQIYDHYYDECQPKQCTYNIKTKNNRIYVITTLIGVIGGLMKFSKIFAPILIKITVYCFRKWRTRIIPQVSTIETSFGTSETHI